MTRDSAVLVLAVAGIITAALGWGAVALFLMGAALAVAVFAPTDDQRDARRRNR